MRKLGVSPTYGHAATARAVSGLPSDAQPSTWKLLTLPYADPGHQPTMGTGARLG
jgi:hypothetical protein